MWKQLFSKKSQWGNSFSGISRINMWLPIYRKFTFHNFHWMLTLLKVEECLNAHCMVWHSLNGPLMETVLTTLQQNTWWKKSIVVAVVLVRIIHVILCLKLLNNSMYCFVQLLILLKMEKLLSPPCTGRPSLKGPSTEAVLVTGFRDPVPTHKEIKILGGDWTSWGPIRSTLSPSPTEKIVAMKGSMVLRSALEIHSRTMATLILGKSTDCFLIGLNV